MCDRGWEVQCEQDRSQKRTLGYSVHKGARSGHINNRMTAIIEIGREPPKSNAPNSESHREPFLENGMIMRVEGCAEVQRDKPVICLTNREHSAHSLRAMIFPIDRLTYIHETAIRQVFLKLFQNNFLKNL